MRKVFASQRLENVEAVANLLEQEGIEVRIEHPRSFRSAIHGNFSYLDNGKRNPPQPAVWVIRSDDQPRARTMLREAGLLQDTTRDPATGLHLTVHGKGQKKNRSSRLRYGLLGLALIIVVVNFIHRPTDPSASSTDTTAATDSPALALLDAAVPTGDAIHVIATPPQLALMLARRVLHTHPAPALCLAIDGHDPAHSTLDALNADGIAAQATSACTHADALHLNVYAYTTDGSGTGDVSVTLHTASHTRTNIVRVRRSGAIWAVLDDGR